jgi:hypothetical protein
MALATTRYTPRFQLPELLEQHRAEVVTCPVYRDGALATPSSPSVALYNAAGTAVTVGSPTVTGGVAQATIAQATLAAEELGSGWRIEWSLTMPDGIVHEFVNEAHLVRRRLYPTITDADLVRRVSALDTTSATVITSASNYQGYIDEADVELQGRLIELGRRPWLVTTPSALRQSWLFLSLSLVFEDLSSRDDLYSLRAAEYREKFEAAFQRASVQFDYDEDGVVGTEERVPAKPAVVWLA